MIVLGIMGAATGWLGDTIGAFSDFNEVQRQNKQDIADAQSDKSIDQQRDAAKMQEMGKQNAYQAMMSQVKGVQAVGTTKSAIGYSGVRGVSSQLGVQQQESMVQRMLQEQIRQGNESVRMAGQESSLLSQKYNRKIANVQEDIDYNDSQVGKLIMMQFLNGFSKMAGLGTKFGGMGGS